MRYLASKRNCIARDFPKNYNKGLHCISLIQKIKATKKVLKPITWQLHLVSDHLHRVSYFARLNIKSDKAEFINSDWCSFHVIPSFTRKKTSSSTYHYVTQNNIPYN